MHSSQQAFVEYFRSPDHLVEIGTRGDLTATEGYFTFGGSICYGRRGGGVSSRYVTDRLSDASDAVMYERDKVSLPFDLSEVATNLRQEQYRQNGYRYLERITGASAARYLYYLLRPSMPVQVRKHLQRVRRGWESISFPRWPVDVSVDTLMRSAMALSLPRSGLRRIPFVWFWPEGARSCAVMTHDVEGAAGREFCGELMDLDDSYDMKSAFQLVPEGHEGASRALAARLRGRGFEVNLHDLNHDGYLFHSRQEFLRRAARINRYAREFQCGGFRSGAMYREQRWYDAFELSYDMSVPNVAHLEPQRGGCCTVMPYFVGDVLELPLTTIQDYSLFHILGDYSISLWKEQIAAIAAQNGLMTFLAHPDYINERRARDVYVDLLSYLREIRVEQRIWMALPADVDRWWRNRHRMTLVPAGGSWRVEGPDSQRARVAYATIENGRVEYVLE